MEVERALQAQREVQPCTAPSPPRAPHAWLFLLHSGTETTDFLWVHSGFSPSSELGGRGTL